MKHLPLVILLALFSAPAMAYVGPGLGLGVIGTIFGVIAAIVLALFGLFWYPLKRAFNKRKGGAAHPPSSSAGAASEQATSIDTQAVQPDRATGSHPENHAIRQTAMADNDSEQSTANRRDSPVQ